MKTVKPSQKARNKRSGYLRVKEIMNEKHPTIYADELATKARATIRGLSLRILPAIGENKKILGVVTRGDVLAISASVSPIRVKGIMTNPKHIPTADDDVTLTVKEMLRVDEWSVPVVGSANDKIYRGVLGLENYIEAIVKTSPEKLAKPVSEIMSTSIVTCTPEDEIDQIWRLMQRKAFAGLPVIKGNKLVGIVTQKDLLDAGAALPVFESAKGRFREQTKVSSIMKTQVIAVEPSIKVIRVAKIMVSKDIGRVPVKNEEGRLIGIVDRDDVVRSLVK